MSFSSKSRFFTIEPEAKEIFGFKADLDPNSDEVLKSKRFIKHAKFFVQMIDRALALLGPEIELLTEIMLDLGEKHVRYGVRAEFFPAMGTALIHAVTTVLGEQRFTEAIRADWLEVYGALSYDMIRGQKNAHWAEGVNQFLLILMLSEYITRYSVYISHHSVIIFWLFILG